MPKVVAEYKEEARARIVKAALRTFSEKGYHQTTMDDIAKRLGVSKGALYLYFPSKEELFRGCYETAPQAFSEILRSTFKDFRNPMQNVQDFFDKMQERFASNSALSYEIFAQASRNPAIRKILKENYDEYARIMTRFLEEMKERGVLEKNLETRALAKALIALWNGMETILTVGFPASEAKRAWLEAMKAMFSRTDASRKEIEH
ncbi:MAG TPA: TetR/AcrR family transcriptional regulator [Candidatus Bathyarchaeia archaeon]|nr:TetR/AcrR family transcriptional regulator [Candidatus Bathyarchaeia archaeon]